MLTRSRNGNELRLFSPADLTAPERWGGVDQGAISSMLLVLWWIENFLARPHKDLGRTGPVCPFVRPALEKETLWLAPLLKPAYRDGSPGPMILDHLEWYLELEPVVGEDAIYKTILFVLPDVTPDEYATIIDATQARLKPRFVEQGLMFGQFHPQCNEGGVRNPDFRPLRCPVPLLVIRKMTSFDFMFLKQDADIYDEKYLRSYFKRFAPDLPAPFVDDIVRIATAAPVQR
jgi:hypothetical protein